MSKASKTKQSRKVQAVFDYEKVKEVCKKRFPDEDYEAFDSTPDDENCLAYLDLFADILAEYGVYDASVLLL